MNLAFTTAPSIIYLSFDHLLMTQCYLLNKCAMLNCGMINAAGGGLG